MPLTLARATRHVTEWTGKLAQYPTRANWPAHVFHTCQLEVAVEIIKSGGIKCRNKVGTLLCDVANQGALWNNPAAHDYVRLYFRPRNRFHIKTEGVKAIGDQFRVDPHMSIPIALAFDLQQVITLPDSGFVPGNFAKTGAALRTTEAEFDTMQFDLIYHDAALNADNMAEVHNWRMSEVVVKDWLPLSSLSFVICRTTHEERTLRHALGKHHAPNTIVEQKGAIFVRWGMFIDEIYWASDRLYLKFHGPSKYTKDQYRMRVVCWDRGTQRDENFLVKPGYYRLESLPASKDAIWRIELEGCVVYHAPVPSMSGLVPP
jgi:hypothetical protein